MRRRAVTRRRTGWALGLAALLLPTQASAQESRVQANAVATVGAAGVGAPGNLWADTRFFAGARGDVLFGRSGPHSWGAGPMLGLGTYGFRDLQLQGGASVLIPAHEYLPFVLSGGGYFRNDSGLKPGAFTSLFWGSRSYNYHGTYGLVVGLAVEARAGFGDDKERTILIAAHLDMQAMILPVVMLINAFR